FWATENGAWSKHFTVGLPTGPWMPLLFPLASNYLIALLQMETSGKIIFSLSAVLFAFSFTSALAQASAPIQIFVGPVAGAGVSWVTFQEKTSKQYYKQVPVATYS